MASVPHCLRANKQIWSDCSTEPAGLSAIHTCIHPTRIHSAAERTKKRGNGWTTRKTKQKKPHKEWSSPVLHNFPIIFKPLKDHGHIIQDEEPMKSETHSDVTVDVMTQKLWYHSCRLLADFSTLKSRVHKLKAAPKVHEFRAACPKHYTSIAVYQVLLCTLGAACVQTLLLICALFLGISFCLVFKQDSCYR